MNSNNIKFKTRKLKQENLKMTKDEALIKLGSELKEFYNSAPRGDSILRLEYFVIKNSNLIINNNIQPRELLKKADMGEKKICPEINRALKLSRYVKIIKEI